MTGRGDTPAVDVFLCYAHRDQELCEQFREHLSGLRRARIISDWHDRQIESGGDWGARISDHLERAHVILFLVSSSFMSSDYCQDIEVSRAMERHRRGDAVVVPIVLRDCEWRDAPFGHLNPLPRRHRAVSLAPDRDESLADITRELREIIQRRWAEPGGEAPHRTAISTDAIPEEHRTLAVNPTRLFIVIQKDVKAGPVFNMDGTLANSGGQAAVIHRLDAQLTDPHESSFRMRWNLFYEYQSPGLMQKKSDPHPITVSPRSEEVVGIQFLAPASVRDYDWPIGKYRFDLLAWLSASGDPQRPDFARRCPIAVDAGTSKDVRQWATAPEEKWVELNDPHNAVAVEVAIHGRSRRS